MGRVFQQRVSFRGVREHSMVKKFCLGGGGETEVGVNG